MFTAASFHVGDRVTIHSGQSGPQAMATVERYTNDGRCMVLSDGSEWRSDGRRQWGFRGGYYKGPVVEPAQPGDEDYIGKRRVIGVLRKFADGLTIDTPLSAEALRRILDAVEKEKAALPAVPSKDSDKKGGDKKGGDKKGGDRTGRRQDG